MGWNPFSALRLGLVFVVVAVSGLGQKSASAEDASYGPDSFQEWVDRANRLDDAWRAHRSRSGESRLSTGTELCSHYLSVLPPFRPSLGSSMDPSKDILASCDGIFINTSPAHIPSSSRHLAPYPYPTVLRSFEKPRPSAYREFRGPHPYCRDDTLYIPYDWKFHVALIRRSKLNPARDKQTVILEGLTLEFGTRDGEDGSREGRVLRPCYIPLTRGLTIREIRQHECKESVMAGPRTPSQSRHRAE